MPRTPRVAIIMGSRNDWETMQHAADRAGRLRRAVRAARRLRAPHARPALRLRRTGRGARHSGHHRRGRRAQPTCRGCVPPRQPAGPRRAGRVGGAARRRFAPVDRSDAGGHPGWHARHWQGGGVQRRASSRSPSWPFAIRLCARSSNNGVPARPRPYSNSPTRSPVKCLHERQTPRHNRGVFVSSQSGIRESNPSHSLGKAGHSRYTNPATTAILTARSCSTSLFSSPRSMVSLPQLSPISGVQPFASFRLL